MNWFADADSRRFILRGYLPRLTIINLAWEIAQLPLYTLWENPHLEQIAFAVAHCTAGDLLIASLALLSALILVRAPSRREWSEKQIVAVMVSLAMAYTVFSEQNNLALGNWTYAAAMPLVPGLEVGLAPLLQWLLVPLAAWRWANRRSPSDQRKLTQM